MAPRVIACWVAAELPRRRLGRAGKLARGVHSRHDTRHARHSTTTRRGPDRPPSRSMARIGRESYLQPVVGKHGLAVIPTPEFPNCASSLTRSGWRVADLCPKVMTGISRWAYGGSQSLYKIRRDLDDAGQDRGGGMRSAAKGLDARIRTIPGRREGSFRPDLSGHPWPRRLGIATLKGAQRHESLSTARRN